MNADESILAEHHVVIARTRLSRSVFGAQVEEAISLFATERRLVQVQMVSMTGPTPASSAGDKAEVVDLPYDGIRRLVRRRAVRLGEAAMGAVILTRGKMHGSYDERLYVIMESCAHLHAGIVLGNRTPQDSPNIRTSMDV